MTTAVEGIPLPLPYPKTTRNGWHALAKMAKRRLTEVLEAAKSFPFDDSSRIVLFSDCHRGDNSRADAFAENAELFLWTLTHYYQKGFTYIEVGDGDELWKNQRFRDIRQAHGRIFDLLHRFDQQGRLHLIVGNHDIQGKRRGQVEKDGIATQEGLILHHSRTGQRVFVVHGHQADFKSDYLQIMGRLGSRHIWKRIQALGLGHTATQPDDTRNRRKIRRTIIEWLQDHQQVIICGHTHFPMSAAYGAPPYFNTGSCVYPGYITGIEIQNGDIMLVKWAARSRPEQGDAPGIERTLIAPPRKLRLFS